mgnify:CR=1 FL=1
MEGCPNLKAVCKFGVGTDNIDLDYAKERNIHVGRCVGSNSRSVAEHVLSMMFMEAKNLYTSVRDVKQHGWNKPTGREIYGKKLGIIGFGMIGKYLASMLTAVAWRYMPMMPLQSQRKPQGSTMHRFPHWRISLQTVIISLYTYRFWSPHGI